MIHSISPREPFISVEFSHIRLDSISRSSELSEASYSNRRTWFAVFPSDFVDNNLKSY